LKAWRSFCIYLLNKLQVDKLMWTSQSRTSTIFDFSLDFAYSYLSGQHFIAVKQIVNVARQVLSAFAHSRKATICFVMSVRLSARKEQVGCSWTDFCEILCWAFSEACRRNSSWVQIV